MKETYDHGTGQLKAKFLSRLKILAQLPENEWREPHIKHLNGPCDGLTEIRFKADNVQQRPLGYRSGPNEFTILFWATEKNNRFVPLTACEKALARKQTGENNKEHVHDLWLVLE